MNIITIEPGVKYALVKYTFDQEKMQAVPMIEDGTVVSIKDELDLSKVLEINFCRSERVEPDIKILSNSGKVDDKTNVEIWVDSEGAEYPVDSDKISKVPVVYNEEEKYYYPNTPSNSAANIKLEESNVYDDSENGKVMLMIISDKKKEAIDGITHEDLIRLIITDLSFKVGSPANENIVEAIKKLKEASMWIYSN